ncbi:MAG: hypothetical protein NUV94_07125 [Candidatus Acetothermia bacterium]|nr:hypothetical protein [Candidatus Acetothermia bacterium]
MATWKKALAVALAAFAQVSVAEEVQSVLPNGEELGDEELLQAEGEFGWFLIGLILGGRAMAVYENWFDEDYGIDKDDLREIFRGGIFAGICGQQYGMMRSIVAWFE